MKYSRLLVGLVSVIMVGIDSLALAQVNSQISATPTPKPKASPTPKPKANSEPRCPGDDCPRGEDEIEGVAYVITPRSSQVYQMPKLRWYKVEGASSYTVKITDDSNRNKWHKIFADNEVIYDEMIVEVKYDGEILAPGQYTIEVTSDHSTQTDTRVAIFEVISPEKAQEFLVKKSALDNLQGEEKLIALDQLYSEYGLISELIDLLKSEPNKTARIYHRLSELFNKIRLSKVAKKYQEKAEQFDSK